MAVFNFKDVTFSSAVFSGTVPATPTALAQYNVTNGGVDFTVSYAFVPTGPSVGGMAKAQISDTSGTGLRGFATFTTTAGTPTTFGLRVTISFAMTAARTMWNVSFISGNIESVPFDLGTANITGTSISFTTSAASRTPDFFLSALGATFTCFCAGTRIATVDGFKEVQDLVPGDRLRLADGGETEVRWLGRQSVSKTFADPRRVNPICIKAQALGNAQDLFVSPDHGIALDGHLINASALVNGETIYQVAEMPGDFTYYHVETEAHELILAEEIATESYLDLPSREVFDNGHERAEASRVKPMALPRISSIRLVPTPLARALSLPGAA